MSLRLRKEKCLDVVSQSEVGVVLCHEATWLISRFLSYFPESFRGMTRDSHYEDFKPFIVSPFSLGQLFYRLIALSS